MTSLAAVGWHAARVGAYFWRFGTLPLSRRLAKRVPRPFVLTRRFAGGKIAVDLSRTDTHRLLFLEGERFVAEAGLLRSLIRPGMCVVDVGANIGYYAVLFSEAVGPNGRVVCLEPEPDNLRELEANVAINSLGNVTVLPFAAGDRDTELSLRRGLNASVVENGGGTPVTVKRIDSLDLGQVDMIKIDVEGFEQAVLLGARRQLEEHRPSLFVEVHPNLLPGKDQLSAIFELLRELYGKVEGHRDVPASSAIGKLLERYAGRGIESTGDASSWIEAALRAPRTPPFWLVARRPGM